MSFYTSLSGLKGAQSELSVISNNIANVGSVGFKKSRTEFGDLVSASPLQASGVAGQGTRLKGISQEFSQGGFQATDRALDLAISGQGFFITHSDMTGGQLAFTRNGAFSTDANRYVVDSAGNYLQVLPVDDQGTVTSTSLSATRNLQIPLTSGEAHGTAKIDTSVIFPADADIPANRTVFGSPSSYAFDRLDPNSYNYASATTVYDAAGNPQQATIYYVRTSAPTETSSDSTWEAHLFVGNSEASANGSTTTPATPLQLTFDATGALTAPSGAVTFGNVQPTGAISPMSLTLDFGNATKQAASPFTVGALTQDGYAAGQLDSVSVGADGLVTATFSNGATQKLGKVAMANFANPAGLRQLGDSSWGITGQSGDPTISEPGAGGMGSIQSGALEQANVDITEELVALIAAQRNFQANAKAIDTANTLTQTVIQLN
ncbi:MAG TPA: flagellar hook protein FlgE [Sphingomonadaceae bacterium]|nr:flagellar hook protein FlgE [Sphingomonadaceae bacterium]